MRFRFITAALCAGLVAQSAFAGQMFDPNVVPAVRLGVSFGGPVERTTPFELALQLQYRGVLTWSDPDLQRDHKIQLAPLSVDMITLSGNRAGLTSALVFSHDLLADHYTLRQDGESSSGTNWVWWAIGGVAVTAAAVLAAAGGGGGDASSTDTGGGPENPGSPQGCNIVGGNNVSGGEVYLTQGCEEQFGVPDVP